MQARRRLARLRVSQAKEELISLERELGCEKLRPQLLRLKESIGLDSTRADARSSPRQARRRPRS